MKLVYRGRLPGLNEVINKSRRNPYEANKLKKDTQRDLYSQFIPQYRAGGGRPFAAKVHAVIHFYEPNAKRDEDNVISGMKFIFDALQELGIIPNDSQKFLHISGVDVRVDRENPRVEIRLEAVDAE